MKLPYAKRCRQKCVRMGYISLGGQICGLEAASDWQAVSLALQGHRQSWALSSDTGRQGQLFLPAMVGTAGACTSCRASAVVGLTGTHGMAWHGRGIRCSAPLNHHRRLLATPGLSHLGRCSAASMSRNSPSLSHIRVARPLSLHIANSQYELHIPTVAIIFGWRSNF